MHISLIIVTAIAHLGGLLAASASHNWVAVAWVVSSALWFTAASVGG